MKYWAVLVSRKNKINSPVISQSTPKVHKEGKTPKRNKRKNKSKLNLNEPAAKTRKIEELATPVSAPKVRKTLFPTNNCVDVSPELNSPVNNIDYWLPEFSLTNEDRETISKKGGGLNTTTINAVHSIFRKQFPSIEGFQNSDLTPVYDDETNKWIYAKPYSKINAGAQIHFDGKNPGEKTTGLFQQSY